MCGARLGSPLCPAGENIMDPATTKGECIAVQPNLPVT